MHAKFACADFTFPLLPHHKVLQLIAMLEFTGVDIGLFENRSHLWSSREEEAELDLFAEQVVWAGLTAWFVECFEIGVDQGFAPNLMVMELCASGETAEIFAAMTHNGFFKQMTHHSTTSQYGTLSRGPSLIDDAMRARAILRDDAQSK